MSKTNNGNAGRFWQVVNTVLAGLVVAGVVGMIFVAREATGAAERVAAIKDNVNRNTKIIEAQRGAVEEIGKDIREIKTILRRIEKTPPKP